MVELPTHVRCDTYFRPNFESLEGAEETVVTIRREDRVEVGTGETVEYPTMTFRGVYAGDAPEGHHVQVFVNTPEGQRLLSVLYQFTGQPDLLRADFSGGHGFTGLHYVSNGASQLQFFCRAEWG